MKLSAQTVTSNRPRSRGFTLVEMLVAFAIGVVVLGFIAVLTVFTAKNYLAMSNYVQMDNQSRIALDKISREIRNASALLSANSASMLLTNAIAGTWSRVAYDSGGGTLTLEKSNEGKITLLTGCDTFQYSLYDRYPTTTDLSFHPSTNYVTGKIDVQFCKVINMNWKCSRKILGSKVNTEIVQTAQVVMRNQVYK